MTNASEASSLTSQNETDMHGKPVTMPQRRRKNNFQKGKSGNPNGKPKGALHKKTILEGMMKYNMIVSPNLLRRSESILEKIVERAEQTLQLEDCDSAEEYSIKLRAKEEAERLIVQYVL